MHPDQFDLKKGRVVEIDLNTLLVALMFVTILSMGIGNILLGLADIFNHATPTRRDRTHVAWIVLMLVVHFNMFWHTKAILGVDDWQFGGFLLAMAGPVLMFFATSIMLTDPPAGEGEDLRRFFDALGLRFYLMFAALQAWIIFVSYSLMGQFVPSDLVNLAFLVLSLLLAAKPRDPYQRPGIFLAWGLGLGSLVLRWFS